MTKERNAQPRENPLEAYTKKARQTTEVRPAAPVVERKRERNATINVRLSYRNRLRMLSTLQDEPIQKIVESLIDKACKKRGI